MQTPELTLYVSEDIEFLTREQWDALQPSLILVAPPTPQQLEREAQLAIVMSQWMDDYEKAMEPLRMEWMNEVWNA